MDCKTCAQELYAALGGSSNLVRISHCATRLRIAVVSEDGVDPDTLETIEGVKGAFFVGGELQIIIGPGAVNRVYDAFLLISGLETATISDVSRSAAAKQPIYKRIFKGLGDIFIPILPAIVASGLLSGLVEGLGVWIPGFQTTDWYRFLSTISTAVYHFLPVLVGFSAARLFGGSEALGAMIGMMFIHPDLVSNWGRNAYQMVIPNWDLGLFVIPQMGYQGRVVPVILTVWVLCKLERVLHKHIPDMLDFFITPLASTLVAGILGLAVIGPLFGEIEWYALKGAHCLIELPGGIGAFVMGSLYPLTVVTGIHHIFNVIELDMLTIGQRNTWMPIASAANMAQGAACLAVALKSRTKQIKSLGMPAAYSALLGITEPALFGINLRHFRPMVCAMIGGGMGAAVGAMLGVGATASGVTGLFGFLTTPHCTLTYAVVLGISFSVTFLLCFLVWDDDRCPNRGLLKRNRKSTYGTLCAVCAGSAVLQKDIPDATFAQGLLGVGFGIIPEEDTVGAPCGGTVTMVAASGHAVTLRSADGMEVLIHVGINTSAMQGKGFHTLVSKGDQVRLGDCLVQFDRAAIQQAGYSDMITVMVCNAEAFLPPDRTEQGHCRRGAELFHLTKRAANQSDSGGTV